MYESETVRAVFGGGVLGIGQYYFFPWLAMQGRGDFETIPEHSLKIAQQRQQQQPTPSSPPGC